MITIQLWCSVITLRFFVLLLDNFLNFLFIISNDTMQRPRALQGYTTMIANDDGHLRPQFRRSKTGSLSTFTGTWDLPRRLPGMSPTSFSSSEFLKTWFPALSIGLFIMKLVQVYLLTAMNRATLLHVKSTILHCPPSIITRQRSSVDSKLLHEMSVITTYKCKKTVVL